MKKEDDLKTTMQPKTNKSKNNNIFENGRRPQLFWKRKMTSKKVMHPKTIKSKNNGCGTAPGNLVVYILSVKENKCFFIVNFNDLMKGRLASVQTLRD